MSKILPDEKFCQTKILSVEILSNKVYQDEAAPEAMVAGIGGQIQILKNIHTEQRSFLNFEIFLRFLSH